MPRMKGKDLSLMKWNFLRFPGRMQLGWTDSLKKRRFIVLSKIAMVTNLQGQMVSRWLSFSLVGIFLKQEIMELFGNFHS